MQENIWTSPWTFGKLSCFSTKVKLAIVKHGGDHVMIWRCMTYNGVDKLSFIDGISKAKGLFAAKQTLASLITLSDAAFKLSKVAVATISEVSSAEKHILAFEILKEALKLLSNRASHTNPMESSFLSVIIITRPVPSARDDDDPVGRVERKHNRRHSETLPPSTSIPLLVRAGKKERVRLAHSHVRPMISDRGEGRVA
ncbi:hypothetical protein Trydic_g8261 [Trypoxylus dichotomus]